MSTDTQNSAPVSVGPAVTLNGSQLLQALDFIAPDRDTDPTQLEGDVSILYRAGHAGSGYYCYLTDYPDEGAIMLDAETADDLISSDRDQALTQQTLDDVKAGIPARDAEIEALYREIETVQAQHAATLANIEAFVACDASAISYVSLGEYRTALLKMLRQAPAEKEPGA